MATAMTRTTGGVVTPSTSAAVSSTRSGTGVCGCIISATRSMSLFASTKQKPIASNDLSVTEIVNRDIEERNAAGGIGNDLFSVFHCSGKQFKASPGDIVIVDNMMADLGSLIKMEKVLMIGSKDFTAMGAPLLKPGLAAVHARVVEKTRSRREIVYKFKKRKRYRKKNHHRHFRTLLRIEAIHLAPQLEGTDGVSGDPVFPPHVKRKPVPRSQRMRASLNVTQVIGPELHLNEYDHDYTNDDDLTTKTASSSEQEASLDSLERFKPT